ncbi:MAG: ABC transporter substrate-binding protein [Promethearchaeota archaeon]
MRIRVFAFMILLCALISFPITGYADEVPAELRFDDVASGPYVDKLVYRTISSESSRVQALLDNEIDILDGPIDFSYISTLNSSPEVELSSILRNGYGVYTINCAKYPLSISSLRRAFALALDKERISTEVLGGKSVLHDSLVPLVNPFCAENSLPGDYYSNYTNEANQLLDAAGFLDINADGFREAPDGTTFQITIEYGVTQPRADSIAVLAADALSAISINVDISPGDSYEILYRLYSHGDFDVIFGGRNFYDFGLQWLEKYYDSSHNHPGENPSNYINATLDAYMDILLTSTSYMEIYDAAEEIQKILFEDSPEIVLYEEFSYSAYRKDRFEGHVVDIINNVENEWTNLNVHLTPIDGGPFTGTLRIGMSVFPSTLNPMLATHYSNMVLDNLFARLIKIGPDGEFRTDLAGTYLVETHADNASVPAGYMRFTFDILSNGSWSDGTSVTADDVAYSFNYYMNAGGGQLAGYLEDMTLATAPNSSRVIVEFDIESYWHLYSLANLPILPRSILESLGPTGWSSWDPVFTDPFLTCGPFIPTAYSLDNYVELSQTTLYHHRVRGTGSALPFVSGPTDMTVINGTTGSSIGWSISDDNALAYCISKNGTAIAGEYYDASTVDLDLDTYLTEYGVHNFTIRVQDWDAQISIDTVLVEFLPDTFAPDVAGPDDFLTFDVFTSGTLISWTVFDHNPASYSILLDGIVVASEDWTSAMISISHDIGVLSDGEYNFTIYLVDDKGYSSTDTVIVTVVSDEVPPVIDSPDDVVMNFGELDQTIQWNATDLYPYTFTIYLNSIVNVTGTWESGVSIIFSLDGLEAGSNNVTIEIRDSVSNAVTDTVNVLVHPPGYIPPEVLFLTIAGASAVVVIVVIILKVRK